MKPLLTRKEAAKLLGCSTRTIDLWRIRNALPFMKVGHFVRYDPEELERWVNERSHNKKGSVRPTAEEDTESRQRDTNRHQPSRSSHPKPHIAAKKGT